MEVPALLCRDWGVKFPLEIRAAEDLIVLPKVLAIIMLFLTLSRFSLFFSEVLF